MCYSGARFNLFPQAAAVKGRGRRRGEGGGGGGGEGEEEESGRLQCHGSNSLKGSYFPYKS